MAVRVCFVALAGVALSGAALIACGGSSPSGSTPPVTSAPQPTPTPSTGGGGVGAACALGKGDPNAECAKTSSKLLGALLSAMDLLVQQKPQLFDKSDEFGAGTGQYRVVDREAYLNCGSDSNQPGRPPRPVGPACAPS